MWAYAFVFALIIAFLGWVIVSWWRDAQAVKSDARAIFGDIRGEDDHPLRDLTETAFIALYSRVHRVRRPAYVALFIALALAGSVAALMLMALVRQYMFMGPLLWGFQTFFALILFWVIALAITLKIYHARKPGTLEEEHRRSRS